MPVEGVSTLCMVLQVVYRRISHSMVCLVSSFLLTVIDPELVEERRKTEDMVRQIREKLNQIDAATSGTVNEFGSQGMISRRPVHSTSVGIVYPEMGFTEDPVYAEVPRMKSTLINSIFPAATSTPLDQNSTRSRASSCFDEDLLPNWAVGSDMNSLNEWGYVQGRRATFDESDFNRYRDPVPVWKCRFCLGVGWSERDPCDTCGRFLPVHQWNGGGLFPRPGDWVCTICANTNWEWRTQCNRCHTCKDTTSDLLSGALDPSQNMLPKEGIVKQRLRKRLSTHPAGVFKDNDWVCVCCGNINWDWRSKCHQCGGGKPTVSSSSAPSQPPQTMLSG